MAQSVERRLGKAEVTGSIPVSSLFLRHCIVYTVPFSIYQYMFFTFLFLYDIMSPKEGIQMRKYFSTLVLSGLILSGVMTGCSSAVINLSSDVFVVPVGEEISTDVSEYVRASKNMLAEMTVDVSNVDKDVIGTYTATIYYGDESKEFYIKVADEAAPEITLKTTEVFMDISDKLTIEDIVENVTDFSECEYGFSNDLTLADKNKTISDSISFDKEGEYTIEVLAKDKYDNYSVKEVSVHIGDSYSESGTTDTADYSEYMNTNPGVELGDLESYDSTAVSYGVGNNFDSETNRPVINYYTERFGDYAVDFIQPDSNYIWLTFNEIAEYGNTEKILDTLAEKDVKAVFFVTLSYVQNNPDLVKRMINEGHVLGNYTANCSKVPELSVNKLTSELDTLYNYVYQTYGYEMYLFRTPSGNFSEKALAVAQSKGYRTVFWSFHYADWNINNQPPVDEALENALNRVHGGAIYLLSGSSATNQQMLGDLIDGIRDKGYEFAVYQKN